jgi:putative ABC transport system permease protein
MGLKVATSARLSQHGARGPTSRAAPRGWWRSRRSAQTTRCAASCSCAARPTAPVETVAGAPAPGTVWVDAAAARRAAAEGGRPLLLGDASLRIDRLIVIEPDRGAGFMSFAPRVMLNQADLDATGLVQPASRVNWRLAVAATGASDGPVKAFVQWAELHIQQVPLRGVRVESLESGRPEMRQTLDRAEKFLNLVALLAALLAAVAVGIAARDFAESHLDDCAMLRVLGQSQRRIAGAYTLEFAFVGLLASSAGVLLGLGCTTSSSGCCRPGRRPAAAARALAGAVRPGRGHDAAAGLRPAAGAAAGTRAAAARDPARRGQPQGQVAAGAGRGPGGFVALLMAVSSDVKLGAIAVGGFAVAVGVFALLAWAAVALLRRVVPEAGAPRWLLLATRQLAARPAFAVLQVSALAVGLLALVLLVLLRTDLIGAWRQATPPDAPNRFVINLQPDQGDAFKQVLADAGVKRYDWYPMIRGRLVAINGQTVTPSSFSDDRAQRLVDREFNLSHANALPAHNQLAGGRWTPDEADALSVEEGLARRWA